MDGRGLRDKSKKLVSDFLDRHPRDKHILIAAATDSSALGAVDAVREHKREKHVAIVGQDCIAEAIAEMQKDKSPLSAPSRTSPTPTAQASSIWACPSSAAKPFPPTTTSPTRWSRANLCNSP
jgi:ABC-type sugar transport system substrate-binding protein